MGSQYTPSPFASAPFTERKKGYVERLGYDLSNLTAKQLLGSTVTAPLTLSAGALKGVSFGLADFGDELQQQLGDFALPDTVVDALDMAGQIGGSFVPYVGASAVAHKVFTGLSVGSKMARGAFTFGAPELARQALTQEFDPQHAARSVATGAAFALPLPRYALAPVVAGTELLAGAKPEEAAMSGLFAALLGPLEGKAGRNQELPVREQLPSGGPRIAGLLGPGAEYNQTSRRPYLLPADAGQYSAGIPRGATVSDDSVVNAVSKASGDALQQLADQAKFVSRRQRDAFAAGQMELPLGKPPSPKTQLEILAEKAAQASTPEEAQALQVFSNTVETLSQLPEEHISVGLRRAIDEQGPESMQAKALRLALAQRRQGFVPDGAPMRNPLKPLIRGVDLVQPGPTNPFEVRSQFEELMTTLRSQGGAAGRTREAQLWELITETRQRVARLRGRGQELPPGEMEEIIARQEKLLANPDIVFQTEEEAYRTGLLELAQKTTNADIDAWHQSLPEWYTPVSQRLLEAGESRKVILAEVERDAMQFRKLIDRQPEGFRELMQEASDAGMSLLPAQRKTVRGGKPRTVIDKFTLYGQGGAEVKKFNSVVKARDWLQNLEAGIVEPESIHEARALAFGRGIVIDSTGDSLMITNQLTGETVEGIQSLDEAVRIVRGAPNVAKAAREIGPQVAAAPPMPGSGGIGGLITEQSPPFCPLQDDLG